MGTGRSETAIKGRPVPALAANYEHPTGVFNAVRA